MDGGQHVGSLDDIERDRRLMDMGFNVLRFWSNDVLRNIDGVMREIEREIGMLNLLDRGVVKKLTIPSPQGEGE